MVKHSALLALGIALVACKASSKTARPPRADDPENQAVLAKLQGYIHCLEDHSKRVFQTADAYLKPLGGNAPTVDSLVVLQPTAEPDQCIEAVAAAKQKQPALPDLELAGDRYAQALASVFALTSEAAAYFDRQTSEHDSARRVALHGKLVAAFAEFEHAQAQLFDRVFRINREIHVDQLARREKKDGQSLAVRADKLMLDAEGFVQVAATTWDRLDALDTAVLTARLTEVEHDLNELAVYSLAQPAETKTFGGYSQFEDHARLFVIASRQLIKRAHDRVAYSDTEKLMIGAGNEASVAGAPASVIAAYNRLVDVYGPR